MRSQMITVPACLKPDVHRGPFIQVGNFFIALKNCPVNVAIPMMIVASFEAEVKDHRETRLIMTSSSGLFSI
jgi:hypothetical protein